MTTEETTYYLVISHKCLKLTGKYVLSVQIISKNYGISPMNKQVKQWPELVHSTLYKLLLQTEVPGPGLLVRNR